MAKRYLIDTSAVIKYINNSLSPKGLSLLDKIVDKECLLSFITEIELQVWNPNNQEDIEVYKIFIENSSIYYVDDQVIKETIRIRKLYNIKIPDAIIATTAIVNKLILVSDNDKDFLRIPEIKYFNPNRIDI